MHIAYYKNDFTTWLISQILILDRTNYEKLKNVRIKVLFQRNFLKKSLAVWIRSGLEYTYEDEDAS